ncbi:FAD-dependent oxidoreductase [Amycolatopsis sp.]|uniref:FAD-dependent oxidoreductase n=1 Tax=Amycolatopsis sp. TaxID=37632 RepID=UPI002BF10265|nr:FAD-dependent oxidoreductase [Amycolatopsis sp.]HVV08145.1 FAD-dependent oxidoreductase [Amycolatopsis sp.]
MKWWTGDPGEPGYDVVVVGSGAAGLVAAAAAAARGLRVAVLEKTGFLGGTSSISAGTVWVPDNGLAGDDPVVARDYLARQTGSPPGEPMLDTLVGRGRDMLAFVAARCGLVFDAVPDYPDYRQDVPGAAAGGRSLQPRLFDASVLGELRAALRPDALPPYTMREFKEWGSWERFPWTELEERRERGIVARGGALIAPLLGGCRDLGVTLVTDAAVTGIARTGEGFSLSGNDFTLHARSGLILASGGFEWDPGLRAEHFGDRLAATCSPPGANTGDGHRLATGLGAALGDLGEAWWAPMVTSPEAVPGGVAKGILIRVERQGPGTITVGRDGRRFANESQNYNSFVRAAFEARAPLPMYLVFDHRFFARYGFLRRSVAEGPPPGVRSGGTVAELAAALGVDAAALEKTVAEFNADAVAGKDRLFGRGEDAYDRYSGDSANPFPNPCLAPLAEPPFYGIPLVTGAFGTAGGVCTDHLARALDERGEIVPGLAAVGNVSRHPMARTYPGAGGTLGPAMTMGFVAGSTSDTSERQAR